MKKVLLTSPSPLERGGLQAFLRIWLECNCNNTVKYEWYLPGGIKDKEFAKEFENIGVELCGNDIVPKKASIKFIRQLKSLLVIAHGLTKILKKDIDIVHINTGDILYATLVSFISKMHHIPTIVVHSHSAGALIERKDIRALFPIFWLVINCCSTKKAACSTLAAEALFGRKHANEAIIVKNTIDTKKFAFSEENRDTLRKQFNLEGCFVIGQVARLAHEKNQKFLLDILNEIIKKDDTSRLLFVGEGPLEIELRTYAKELGIEEYVVFAGATAEPEKYYSAMDVFVLTSFFEGLPITGVEAQTSGLPCFFSETITHEVSLTENTVFLPLKYPPDVWAERILDYATSLKKINRNEMYLKIIESGYDKSSIKKYISFLYDVIQ